ncbi:hypothetical protein M896_070700 [Ordospora colligata OC4]|uniref:Uncharacterized protein n=1 Tax=Ordospora colligata OC4 TaxID=1354746 RepID=A0A0B2UEI0_9MICR|nr:uncharacterized protein M896_070700 [Ordospora colligata OC4]KHN69501.1 hypothetical protein M896_070700 [Ordospora colligata OC4]TBU15245.1 hypothetical protein CWI41_070700 [Ordospora colligata]
MFLIKNDADAKQIFNELDEVVVYKILNITKPTRASVCFSVCISNTKWLDTVSSSHIISGSEGFSDAIINFDPNDIDEMKILWQFIKDFGTGYENNHIIIDKLVGIHETPQILLPWIL